MKMVLNAVKFADKRHYGQVRRDSGASLLPEVLAPSSAHLKAWTRIAAGLVKQFGDAYR